MFFIRPFRHSNNLQVFIHQFSKRFICMSLMSSSYIVYFEFSTCGQSSCLCTTDNSFVHFFYTFVCVSYIIPYTGFIRHYIRGLTAFKNDIVHPVSVMQMFSEIIRGNIHYFHRIQCTSAFPGRTAAMSGNSGETEYS